MLGPGGNLSYFCTLSLYLYPSISVTRIPSKKGPAKQMDANMISQTGIDPMTVLNIENDEHKKPFHLER